MFEVILLSIVQGITEFLPISSSAHLIFISTYLDFESQNLAIDMSLHAGSLFAIIYYFRLDLINFSKNRNLFLKILLCSIPTFIVGYLLIKLNLIDQIRNYKVIGATTIIFGILLYVADKTTIKKTTNFDFKSIFIIGISQILSLIPGVSRSGITISAARLLSYNREDSAKISFLLSLPVLTAVTVFNFLNLYKMNDFSFSKINIVAVFLSFIFSLITIKYFINYIKRYSLIPFVMYRIFLGLVILFLIK